MLHYHNPHEEEGNTNFPGSTTPSWESRATPSRLGDESPRVTSVLEFVDEETESSRLGLQLASLDEALVLSISLWMSKNE